MSLDTVQEFERAIGALVSVGLQEAFTLAKPWEHRRADLRAG